MNLMGFAFITGGGRQAAASARPLVSRLQQRACEDCWWQTSTTRPQPRQPQGIAKVAKNPEFEAGAVRMNVSFADSVQNAMDKMVATFGRVDYCVNGIGVLGESSDVAESSLDTFKSMMDVNTQGVFLVMRAASAAMAKQEPVLVGEARPRQSSSRGAIVNIGSITSYIALPKSLQYTASKHAVLGLSRGGALDNIKDGLKEEIADLIVFLYSPKASRINGVNIVVDGS
ncbi:hypothetical protein E0Z10_g8566 [Xylaria hypoxylon]|uniref:Ketoreductase (KR) domain-containing protein n=1 Tax=Xylaria hypoxylon TaxID=37992 RepID=A0A4Z0YNM6_9PEZI|nr:hypothetical protein E0Z10_g8566 [Xylaria hypoxylon]